MLKVMIADDEEKICQLIEKLIDWQALDMQVVAVAHNGLEALDMLGSKAPDIAITDIRMPGCDGLELIQRGKELNPNIDFIIISGYRHFEYAQSAIKYGVSDYLLKPIKKDELTETLKKLSQKYKAKKDMLSIEEQSKLARKSDEERLRAVFVSNILLRDKRNILDKDIEELNHAYHMHMKDGAYMMAIIKIDGRALDEKTNRDFSIEKTLGIINNLFSDIAYDYESYVEDSFIYMLVNFDKENKAALRKQFRSLLDELMVQASILSDIKITIALGYTVDSLQGCLDSLKNARYLQEERLIEGTDKLYEGDAKSSTNWANSDELAQFNQRMTKAMESLDEVAVRDVLCELRDTLLASKDITGHELLQTTKEICNLYLFFMRNQKIAIDENFLEEFNLGADNSPGAKELFDYLIRKITSSYEEAANIKKQELGRPIRLAKKYIQENYQRPITLEDVSKVSELSPTYLSTMFKKEMGENFQDYLLSVRMDKAKELLKETRDPVALICEKVGYSDVRYFTKTFAKYSGLKPNEYRKLYS